jgi:hypothetical protein
VVAAWCAGEVFCGAGAVLMAAGRALEGISDAIFLAEADAGRQYRDLTGINLPEILSGKQKDRYDEKTDTFVVYEAMDDDEDDEQ